MKKLLIITPTLRSGGGVIRGLQNMLALFPAKKYQIDILPMGYSDANNIQLSNCRILADNFFLTAITSIYNQTTNYPKRIKLFIAKILLTILSKFKCRFYFEDKIYQYTAKFYYNYDLVIAYQEGPCTHFAQYINTSNKIAWIHCDYSEYQKIYPMNEKYIYNQYQHIVCVSQYTLKKFQNIYPSLKNKTLYIYNILNNDFIHQSAKENYIDNRKLNNIQLISIGRLNPVKQFSLIPRIIREMLDLGATNFNWILLGDDANSKELEKINTELLKYKIDNKHFTYLGAKFNPYPYIKNSDILVSTSSSEACPFVVNEARVLGIPVVSNNYPSIYELIQDGIDGRITSLPNIANILVELIMDSNKLKKLKQGMQEHTYKNENIISKIMNLIDGN